MNGTEHQTAQRAVACPHVSILDIFPARIRVTVEPSRFLPNTPCWEWLGAQPDQYGRVMYEGVNWATHRLSYFLWNGDFGGKPMVCHTCDNKPCCNYEHLFPGTASDNNLDRIKWSGTLSFEELSEIRYSTLPDKVLARKFRITPNQVTLIRPRGFYKPKWFAKSTIKT